MLAANKALTRTYLRFGLAMLCLYVVLYGITQWIEAVRGLSETAAGLIVLPMTLISGLVITLAFGLVTGFASAGNQTALYSQAPGEQLGTASGLLRTFGYVGSIASSAITGIVFHASVSDTGVHLIAWIMIGVSLALVLISVLDRTLPARTGYQAT
jgi:hypothetical protein